MQCVIDVTETDISLGERKDCSECAVARAIHRKLPNDRVQIVEHEGYQIEIGPAVIIKNLPLPIVNFINDFDAGLPVSPFSFHLDPDNCTIEMMPIE